MNRRFSPAGKHGLNREELFRRRRGSVSSVALAHREPAQEKVADRQNDVERSGEVADQRPPSGSAPGKRPRPWRTGARSRRPTARRARARRRPAGRSRRRRPWSPARRGVMVVKLPSAGKGAEDDRPVEQALRHPDPGERAHVPEQRGLATRSLDHGAELPVVRTGRRAVDELDGAVPALAQAVGHARRFGNLSSVAPSGAK